jgi:hypothetical protein
VTVDFYSLEARDACGGDVISSKDITSETDGDCVHIGALVIGQDNEKTAFRSYAALSPGGFGKVPYTDEEREMYPGIDDDVSGMVSIGRVQMGRYGDTSRSRRECGRVFLLRSGTTSCM